MKVVFFLTLVGGATIAVASCLFKERWLRGRPPEDLVRIYERDLESAEIEYDVFRRVFEALGQFYRVDPRIIRPDDSFADLDTFDSFRLWQGKERMEQWLAETFKFESSQRIETIKDLLSAVQETQRVTEVGIAREQQRREGGPMIGIAKQSNRVARTALFCATGSIALTRIPKRG